MIIEIVEVPRIRHKSLTKKIVKAQCDHCQILFEFPLASHQSEATNNFCSQGCVNLSKVGGVFQKHLKRVIIDKYGVENPSQVPEIVQKRIRTCLDRFGVSSTLKLPRVRKLTESRTVREKAFESQKVNGTLKTSGPENKFYEWLSTIFSAEDISRWVFINRWSIDFYVKSISTYIQFDGIFWHGLDRPIEEIKMNGRVIDGQIVKKWTTDRSQDRWFSENNFRLVRVTDAEFSSLDKEVLRMRVSK